MQLHKHEMYAEIEVYMRSQCRRVALDAIMDRRVDRKTCEDGKAQCDRCEQQDRIQRMQIQQAPIRDQFNYRDDIVSIEPDHTSSNEIKRVVAQQQQQYAWIEHQVNMHQQDEIY